MIGLVVCRVKERIKVTRCYKMAVKEILKKYIYNKKKENEKENH